MEIFLKKINIFDFKLFIGYPLRDLGRGVYQGIFGSYIHRLHGSNVDGVLPIPLESAIKWDDLSEDNLPINISHPDNIGELRMVEHNIDEINKYLSYYKLALKEAEKYLLLL